MLFLAQQPSSQPLPESDQCAGHVGDANANLAAAKEHVVCGAHGYGEKGGGERCGIRPVKQAGAGQDGRHENHDRRGRLARGEMADRPADHDADHKQGYNTEGNKGDAQIDIAAHINGEAG